MYVQVFSKVCVATVVVCSCLGLAGCAAEQEPTLDEIKGAFSRYIPSYAAIDSFAIEVSENIGTVVEPIVSSRIKTIVQIKENLYSQRQVVSGVPIIAEQVRSGEKGEIWYVARAELSSGRWNITFQPQGSEFFRSGRIREDFPKEALVEGSRELNDYIAEINKAKSAKIKRQQESRIPTKVILEFTYTIKNWGQAWTQNIVVRDTNFEANFNSGQVRAVIPFDKFGGAQTNGTEHVHLSLYDNVRHASFVTVGGSENAKRVAEALNNALTAWRTKFSDVAPRRR